MPPRRLSAPMLSWSSCSASRRALPPIPPPAAAAHGPCWLGQAALCQERCGACDRAGVACGAESGVLGLSPPGRGAGAARPLSTQMQEPRCDGGARPNVWPQGGDRFGGEPGGPLDVLCVGLKSVTLYQYRQSTVCDSKCTSCVHACGLYTVAAGSTQGFP